MHCNAKMRVTRKIQRGSNPIHLIKELIDAFDDHRLIALYCTLSQVRLHDDAAPELEVGPAERRTREAVVAGRVDAAFAVGVLCCAAWNAIRTLDLLPSKNSKIAPAGGFSSTLPARNFLPQTYGRLAC